MHSIVESGLEDYLGGSGSREFHVHLAQCKSCRQTVDAMRTMSGLISALRVDGEVPQPLGFSSRVLLNVREQKGRGFWSLFTSDTGFTRRLAFASLLSLAVVGGYFASLPTGAPAENTPEAVMAHHESGQDADSPSSANMLLTLASYQN